MKLKIKKNSRKEGTIHLNLEGEVTIYVVKKLKDFMLSEITQNESVYCNLSGVDQFDSSGFQLFVFLKREAERYEKSIFFENIGGSIKTVTELYNKGI